MAILVVSAAWLAVRTIRWPLLGDASLMHYVAFLLDHGRVPYQTIGDINFPGAFVPDWIVIHTLGPSAVAWRFYDFLLLTAAGFAFIVIIRPASWKVSLWAMLLFALIHGRDGLYQVGQRELTMAVVLLAAVAFLFCANGKRRSWCYFCFGICVGAAATIKPIALPFAFLAIPFALLRGNSRRENLQSWAAAGGGFLAPVGLVVAWLTHSGALRAFFHAEAIFARYHASLGDRPFAYRLQHAFSPILPLAIVWLLWILLKQTTTRANPNAKLSDGADSNRLEIAKRWTLYLAVALGLAAYLVQGKGYPYHRYTLLAFLLAAMARDLDAVMRRRDWLRWAGTLLFAVTSVAFGAGSALAASRYDSNAELQTALRADLTTLTAAHPGLVLDGQVQCLDSISGCIGTLYELKLVQPTSLIYDEFLFHEATAPAVREARARFWQEIRTRPPQVFVVTAPLFPDGPDHYEKLARWPEFSGWLTQNYALALERGTMSPIHQGGPAFAPPGYRIYVSRNFPSK